MEMNFDKILIRLKAYKRKYYQNILIKGTILSAALILSIFLLFNSLEYTFRLSSYWRGGLLLIFIVVLLVVAWKWIIHPLSQLFEIRKQLTHEEAAKQIGQYFPEINDKLLNIIELQKLSSYDNSLIEASIAQKTASLSFFNFSEAINLKENKQYLKYLVPPVLICLVLLMFIPQLFTEGTERIINFKKEYIAEAPFDFVLLNENLKAFKNEDYTLKLQFKGKYKPNDAYLAIGERRVKMQKVGDEYAYTFNNIQQGVSFNFEAAGFRSIKYNIDILNRPNLTGFDVRLIYPSYLKKEKESIKNAGNLLIPEGTLVQWQFKSINADSMSMLFQGEGQRYSIPKTGTERFAFEKNVRESDTYGIELQNDVSKNKEAIQYTIEVIKDQNPEITVEIFKDTTLYNFIVLGGNISDDYGLTRLQVLYQIEEMNQPTPSKFTSFNIPITEQLQQSFYFPWNFDSLSLLPGSKINFYLQVWDNDGVNGKKFSKTSLFTFEIPTKREVDELLEKTSNDTKDKIANNKERASSIKESLEKMQDELKGKKRLEWKDENKMEDIIRKKEEMNEALEQLREQNEINNLQQERFSEQNEKIREKAQELQKLMDELLDEETKRLYDELKRLLDEEKDINKVQQQLSKINDKEHNLEKELERVLELFKRMQFDQKLDQLVRDMEDLAEEQKNLAQETEKSKRDIGEDLKQNQEKINDAFEQKQQEISKLQEINQELKNPNALQDLDKEQEAIEQEQEQIDKALDKNQSKQAAKHQQKAGEQMKALGEKLAQMQNSMEMEMMQENLDNLRDILDNLVKLSFNQEGLMQEFRHINQSDPRFVSLSQQQIKLKEDAKVIEDSLLSLANRVFQIQSFVTREVDNMNNYMEGSLEALKERKQPKAISEQQFAMTSMNNLALLLNDVLQQMQQQMADAMGNPQKGKGKQPSMNLSELQQELNNKISELKKSGKSGRALSEELAKLAAEQEQIRRALQNEMNGVVGQEGSNGTKNSLVEKMEETEADLVNKELTEKTIQRQQEILTRLLEDENAVREREQDEEREANRPGSYEQIAPKVFEEYIKTKEKEIELLRSVPPRLNPYYLQEVNNYFKRLRNTTIN